jgi:hypothetical protein
MKFVDVIGLMELKMAQSIILTGPGVAIILNQALVV